MKKGNDKYEWKMEKDNLDDMYDRTVHFSRGIIGTSRHS